MDTPSIQQLVAALQESWSQETSFTPAEWSTQNPARGQCMVSTLVVQDYLGGDLRRYHIQGEGFEETHYCNILPSGAVLDTTAAQYTKPVQLTITPIDLKGYTTARERYMADEATQARYNVLKERVAHAISQQKS